MTDQDQEQGKQGRFSHPLTSVEKKLFWWLLRYPFQRVEDIVVALQVSTSTVYRHLTSMIGEGTVEYITPSLGVKMTCRLYYLSTMGIHRAAEQEKIPAHLLARMWGADECNLLRLLPRLSTFVQLQTVINGLIPQAPALLAHEQGQRAELAWHWQREYQFRFSINGCPRNLYADVVLLFYRKANAHTSPGTDHMDYYCALFYSDPGFTTVGEHQIIKQRVETLLQYRDSSERRKFGPHQFPPVLVLAQTSRQREIWQHSTAEAAVSLRTAPLTGAIITLPQDEPVTAPWELPWQKLALSVPGRLKDVFTPLPRQALPPELFKRQSRTNEKSPASASNGKGRIVRGNFSGKAAAVSLTPRDTSDREREDIALLQLCFSQCHLDVLNLLYTYPFLEKKDLAIVLNLQPDSLTRYLYELCRYSCIEQDATERGTRWHVSERGLRFIAAMHHVSLRDITEKRASGSAKEFVQQGLPLLKAQIQRTADIYTFFTSLIDSTRAQGGGHELLRWDIGMQCEYRYLDHGNLRILQPDGLFAYKVKAKQLVAWVEWEGSTRQKQDFIAKLQTYAHFARTREWKAAGFQALPVLLIVLSDQKLYQRIVSLVAEQVSGTGLLVRITDTTNIRDHDPFARIWLPVPATFPAQKESQIQRVNLLDLSQHTTI